MTNAAFARVCVCVCIWVTFKDVLSCEMAGGEGRRRERGEAVGREPAECQYQITGRPSAGTHGAAELAEAL